LPAIALSVILVKADAQLDGPSFGLPRFHRRQAVDDENGRIVGVRAFVGLYTAHVYHVSKRPTFRFCGSKIASVRQEIGFVSRAATATRRCSMCSRPTRATN
jgi:hypothetical protein